MEGFRRETLIGSEYARATIWLLVFGFLASLLLITTGQSQELQAHFVGSESCRKCHAGVYNGWKQTRMANVVRDPKLHPDAVLGDFTHPDPVRTFGLDQWHSYMEAAGSNGTLPNAVMIISRYPHSGM